MAGLLRFLLKLNLIVWLAAAIASVYFSVGEANGPPEKVAICHHGATAMDVNEGRALEAHLAHGDYLGECASGEDAPEVDSVPLYNMWLLTSGLRIINEDGTTTIHSAYWHCLLISETHPSIGRQGELCFPDRFGGQWVADNAACMAPVMSDGTWACDALTPWRIR